MDTKRESRGGDACSWLSLSVGQQWCAYAEVSPGALPSWTASLSLHKGLTEEASRCFDCLQWHSTQWVLLPSTTPKRKWEFSDSDRLWSQYLSHLPYNYSHWHCSWKSTDNSANQNFQPSICQSKRHAWIESKTQQQGWKGEGQGDGHPSSPHLLPPHLGQVHVEPCGQRSLHVTQVQKRHRLLFCPPLSPLPPQLSLRANFQHISP